MAVPAVRACYKTALFGTLPAARLEARRAEARHGEPFGAMRPYWCDEHGCWHYGHRPNFQAWLHRESNTTDYLFTITAEIELGRRVLAYAKRENFGSRQARLALFGRYAATLVRLRSRDHGGLGLRALETRATMTPL